MENNVYEPPKAYDQQHSKPKGSFFRGLLWGIAIDIGGTACVWVVYVFLYAFYSAYNGVGEAEIVQELSHLDPYSSGAIVATLTGLVLSFFGGYICAKKSGSGAPNSVYALCAISSALCFYLGEGSYSIVESLLFAIITGGTIVSGGKLWLKKNA